MSNIKLVLGVFGVCVFLVIVMAFGLSKMSSGSTKINAEELTAGARFTVRNGDSRVTVVEFSDMECPACKSAQPFAEEVKKMDGVRFVFRQFPLINIHQYAWQGAKAVEAARILGKGWEMMDLLFEKQEEWSAGGIDKHIVEYAKSLGMTEKDFREKWTSDEVDKLVGEDFALANRLKLSGTPSFFVDGEQVAANFLVAKVKDKLAK